MAESQFLARVSKQSSDWRSEAMTNRIARLMAEGKLQKKPFRIRCGRYITEVAHYKGI